ncbi:MAG: hypothetical protein VX738_03310 [Planctomycetota bacterium]|nr:hypothetical protein [Planctomycetota bacterium]
MSKKQRRKRRRANRKTAPTETPNSAHTRSVDGSTGTVKLLPGEETRAAEAVTVMWVLCTLATAASLIGTVTFAGVNAVLGEPDTESQVMQMLPQWFVMVGAITGFFGLIMNTLTQRFRNFSAPTIVRLVSAVICFVALGVGLFL